nr:unnamed protein product [Digitaria exilis]
MAEEAPPTPPATSLYVDGCPGCAIDRKKATNKGIPYKELFFVAVTTIASALPISSLFPFLYYMIEDLHVAKTEQDIGFYAGFLGASYFVGRFLASIFWGVVADRIGRKPIIVFSVFSVVIFNTLFGVSMKYWMAITTRLILGALNGMLAPIKAYSIEICRPEHHALGLSIPAQQYPNIFSDKSTFGRFPYLLPCLCISFFAAVVLETLHKHKNIDSEIEMSTESRTPQTEHGEKSLYKNWPLMSAIIAYCIFTLHDTAYSEIISLWTISDRRYGGLSFSSKEVGQLLAIAGAGLIVYQLLIYRPVYKFLGCVNSCRASSALSIPLIAAYPFMTHLSGYRLGLALYSAAIVKGALGPQSQRGAANGIAATAMSFFKAIGPAGAGAVFSWAQKRQHAAFFPGL